MLSAARVSGPRVLPGRYGRRNCWKQYCGPREQCRRSNHSEQRIRRRRSRGGRSRDENEELRQHLPVREYCNTPDGYGSKAVLPAACAGWCNWRTPTGGYVDLTGLGGIGLTVSYACAHRDARALKATPIRSASPTASAAVAQRLDALLWRQAVLKPEGQVPLRT